MVEASPPAPAMQCGGPCLPVQRRAVPASSPLLTPFALGNLNLDVRMVYAPLTRCRALGEESSLRARIPPVVPRPRTILAWNRCDPANEQSSIDLARSQA